VKYWWISQGRNFRYEFENGFIWAPERSPGSLHHWDAVGQVRRDDVLFSYVRRAFIASGLATSDPKPAPRPFGNVSGSGPEQQGCRVQVSYKLIDPPVSLTALSREALMSLSGPRGPLNKHFTGNQGYLFAVPDAAAHELERLISLCDSPRSRGDFI